MIRGALVLGLVAALAGCFSPSLPELALDAGSGMGAGEAGEGSGVGAEAGVDSGSLADGQSATPVDACVSFSAQFDTCGLVAMTTSDLRIVAADGGTAPVNAAYNTDTHVLTVDGAPFQVSHMVLMTKAGPIDAILAHDVTIAQNLSLFPMGTLPFAIVASGKISLETSAVINVVGGGAGALDVCATPAMPGAKQVGGGGGGGGGGYGAGGGAGGRGNKDAGPSLGGTGSLSIALPPGPMGGCPGGKGGDGDATVATGGLGGLGGGAIYLVAANSISLAGGSELNASGGGGKGGISTGGKGDGGGGGGGSGGMIWLEAPHVIGAQSQIAANGGSGGEGSNTVTAGASGHDGSSSTARAKGGNGAVDNGGDGGDGGSDGTRTGQTADDFQDGGGGGGGGGVGYIHVVYPDFQPGSVSPSAN